MPQTKKKLGLKSPAESEKRVLNLCSDSSCPLNGTGDSLSPAASGPKVVLDCPSPSGGDTFILPDIPQELNASTTADNKTQGVAKKQLRVVCTNLNAPTPLLPDRKAAVGSQAAYSTRSRGDMRPHLRRKTLAQTASEAWVKLWNGKSGSDQNLEKTVGDSFDADAVFDNIDKSVDAIAKSGYLTRKESLAKLHSDQGVLDKMYSKVENLIRTSPVIVDLEPQSTKAGGRDDQSVSGPLDPSVQLFSGLIGPPKSFRRESLCPQTSQQSTIPREQHSRTSTVLSTVDSALKQIKLRRKANDEGSDGNWAEPLKDFAKNKIKKKDLHRVSNSIKLNASADYTTTI